MWWKTFSSKICPARLTREVSNRRQSQNQPCLGGLVLQRTPSPASLGFPLLFQQHTSQRQVSLLNTCQENANFIVGPTAVQMIDHWVAGQLFLNSVSAVQSDLSIHPWGPYFGHSFLFCPVELAFAVLNRQVVTMLRKVKTWGYHWQLGAVTGKHITCVISFKLQLWGVSAIIISILQMKNAAA